MRNKTLTKSAKYANKYLFKMRTRDLTEYLNYTIISLNKKFELWRHSLWTFGGDRDERVSERERKKE